jgi:hypothetical protein
MIYDIAHYTMSIISFRDFIQTLGCVIMGDIDSW